MRGFWIIVVVLMLSAEQVLACPVCRGTQSNDPDATRHTFVIITSPMLVVPTLMVGGFVAWFRFYNDREDH